MKKIILLMSLFFFSYTFASDNDEIDSDSVFLHRSILLSATQADNTESWFTEHFTSGQALRMNNNLEADSNQENITTQLKKLTDFQRGYCAVQATKALDQVDTIETVYTIMHNNFLGNGRPKCTDIHNATISPVKKVADERALQGLKDLYALTYTIIVANQPPPSAQHPFLERSSCPPYKKGCSIL